MLNFRGYEQNFDIRNKIGRGGFSSVYKVLNKMDDNFYALKKIKVDIKQDKEGSQELVRVMKEAKTLSSLDHPNIVRYYGSWISENRSETFSFIKPAKQRASPKGNQISKFSVGGGPSPDLNNPIFISYTVDEDPLSEDYNEESSSSSGSEAGDGSTDYKTIGSHDGAFSTENSDPSPRKPVLSKMISPIKAKNSQNQQSVTSSQFLIVPREKVIFIQTELCDLSLEDFLQQRNDRLHASQVSSLQGADRCLIFQAFSLSLQLLKAVRYIHKKHRLIHRDIKPSNIFINLQDGEPILKLGDFGLVRKMRIMTPASPLNDSLRLNQKARSQLASFSLERCMISNVQVGGQGQGSLTNLEFNSTPPILAPKLSLETQCPDRQESPSPPLQQSQLVAPLKGSQNSEDMTKSVGTKLYASPEQMASSSYNYRSDIFSFGLVILRIFVPTYTYMAMIKQIQGLKMGQKIEELDLGFPLIQDLLWRVALEDPKMRPSLDEIEKVLVNCQIEVAENTPAGQSVLGPLSSGEKVQKKMQGTSSWKAFMYVEDTEEYQDVTMFVLGKEILLFYDEEKKSRFSVPVDKFSIFIDPKTTTAEFKSPLRANLKFVLDWRRDLEELVDFLNKMDCYIQNVEEEGGGGKLRQLQLLHFNHQILVLQFMYFRQKVNLCILEKKSKKRLSLQNQARSKRHHEYSPCSLL